jgi:Fic family protein
MTWLWEQPDWPSLRWRDANITQPLAELRHEQGRLLGRMQALGLGLREQASLHTLTRDVTKSSEIEGEIVDTEQVRSSIARRLGIDIGALKPVDRHVEGVVEMMLDATSNYEASLTKDRLCGWHAALFPTGRSGMLRIRVGDWRDDGRGPMRVVSGALGRERIHYQAPPADRLDAEMDSFLAWFNHPPAIDPVLKAALAHLWFVTIHPFDDGNGRIARAIADLALTRADRSPQRFYSMSAQIRAERPAYHAILELTQTGTVDITGWMQWFLACLHRAISGAGAELSGVLAKAAFWAMHANTPLNRRQTAVLNRLLDGFEGKLSSSKWAKLTKCSQDTAGRDIAGLLALGILRKGPAGGRSTSYELANISGL